MKNNIRKEIMSECPEEFQNALENWIGGLESQVNEIRDALDINSLNDLTSIQEAYELASSLSDDLY